MSAGIRHRAHARRPQAPLANSRGITLLEVLIALVILSIGLLGLAGLQTISLQFNTSAYYRTQATALAYGLADRMRSNRQAALDGDYDGGIANTPPACDPDAAPASTPAGDVAAWRNALACQLPQGTGAVESDDTEFTITVQWDDRDTAVAVFEFTTAL